MSSGGGRLIVNDVEAARIREIFKLYAKHRSLAAVVSELQPSADQAQNLCVSNPPLHQLHQQLVIGWITLLQVCVSPSESGFLLGQEAADGGSAFIKLAGDLGFTAALLVQRSGFDVCLAAGHELNRHRHLAQDLPCELGEPGEQSGQIERFGQRHEAYPEMLKFL
jgi:hypothetical protein